MTQHRDAKRPSVVRARTARRDGPRQLVAGRQDGAIQGGSMKFAYADPPYVGQAQKHYSREEVDHAALIRRLVDGYPDGWALSCSSPSLATLLPMCPKDVRIAAWVKPFASFKPNVNPAYAWEPVIFRGGRKRGRDVSTVRDWIDAPITLQKGLVGAKPPRFCRWLFDLLGMEPGDDLDDLFPGTGIVTYELELRRQQADESQLLWRNWLDEMIGRAPLASGGSEAGS